MTHVFAVFNRLGFQMWKPGEQWDVMWSHGYPFNAFQEDLKNLKPHQKVHTLNENHSHFTIFIS